MQALRTDGTDIRVGEGRRAVVINTSPMEWLCPVALDVVALSRIADLGKEIAEAKKPDEDEEPTADEAAGTEAEGER